MVAPSGSKRGVPGSTSRSGTMSPAWKRPVASSVSCKSALSLSDPSVLSVSVPGEIADAVRDHAVAVPLDAADDVRARAPHEVCPCVDHRVREPACVPARLAEERLVVAANMLRPDAFRARVHVDEHDVRVPRRSADEPRRPAHVEQALRPAVRRAADQRDLHLAGAHVRDLSGQPLMEKPGTTQRSQRLVLRARAVVVRMVVGDVHHHEAGSPQHGGPVGRAAEREAASSASAPAFGRAARGERSFEVADHEVLVEEEATDTGEDACVGTPRERDVTAADERERRRRRLRVGGSSAAALTGAGDSPVLRRCAAAAPPRSSTTAR